MHNTELWVQRHQLDRCALLTLPSAPLQPGQVRLHIERFALTSNNITYAAMGEAMAYWQFLSPARRRRAGTRVGSDPRVGLWPRDGIALH